MISSSSIRSYADLIASSIWEDPKMNERLSPEAVVVYEHSRRTVPPGTLGKLEMVRTRSHASSSVSIYAPAGVEKSD